MKAWKLFWVLLAFATASIAQQPATNRAWRYTLLDASAITEDCPVCGRPTVPYPLRGTFDLLLENFGPLFTTYCITNVQFYAGQKDSPLYSVEGNGVYRIGGPLAIQQDMTLRTEVCNSTTECRDVTFTNNDVAPVQFPLIQISVTQTQASFTSVYTMQIIAAPVREIWFGVMDGFTSTNSGTEIMAGDVLSQQGRIVRPQTELFRSIGITNPPPTLRVDALDVVPGGEIYFSISENVISSTLGALQHGDLLSDRGKIVRSNQQLTAAFGIQPVVPDVGLDAVQVMPDGEILFSISTNVFAEGKGTMLTGGDVLSSSGQIVKRNGELWAKFHTNIPGPDLGLDGFYVWPNGEIWFSLESGFPDMQLGEISGGDLLSTEGVIVFRGSELVSTFGAPQKNPNFGLGDIFVVSDSTAIQVAPAFLAPRVQQENILLQWTGTNRVFQLERAGAVNGPWQSAGEIDPRTSSIQTNIHGNAANFYRLQAW